MFDPKTKELIGVAASVVAKCQPCLEYHLAEARKAGASDSEIRTAVKIAQSVRKSGDQNMDRFSESLLEADCAVNSSCDCGSGCDCW